MGDLHAGWIWAIGGLLLLIAEMVAPGFFLLFIGAAAIATGLFTLLFDLGLAPQLALFVVYAFFREARRKRALVAFFFAATASHGALDAMTNGGLGVAFFAPFAADRYFFPFGPIEVSPIGVSRFFSGRGLAVVLSELLWVWLPVSLAVAVVALVARRAGGGGL